MDDDSQGSPALTISTKKIRNPRSTPRLTPRNKTPRNKRKRTREGEDGKRGKYDKATKTDADEEEETYDESEYMGCILVSFYNLV